MARKKRRSNPLRGATSEIVQAAEEFWARTSADLPLNHAGPPIHLIPKGAYGIAYGPALGEPHLTIVQFDLGEIEARVEVNPEKIEAV